MSVWLNPSLTQPATLHGREGELVSVSIAVAPCELERLLDALAGLNFPINPQIYHDASLVSVAADGSERAESVAAVEFPAYADGLEKVRAMLGACGFGAEALQVTSMLEEIHSDTGRAASTEAGQPRRSLRKHPPAALAH